MIDWFAFLTVLITSVVAGCVVMLLFSLGLRFANAAGTWRRPIGITAFALCGLVVLFGLYLIIPALHP